jgi:hypothetical protein
MLKVKHAILNNGIVKGKNIEVATILSNIVKILIIIIIAQMEAIHCRKELKHKGVKGKPNPG